MRMVLEGDSTPTHIGPRWHLRRPSFTCRVLVSADRSRIDSAMLAQRLLGSDRQRERLARAFRGEQSSGRLDDDAIREKSELFLVRIPVWERNLLRRAFLRVAHERFLKLSRLDNEA